ncbi:hypothetical protein [Streptococcus pyogenes]|uniref:hypothetical protein n=1 Tax=Streptococcus pyogenes TaxID=1314 RepID=UPI0010F40CA6|nr:hypothetical protein [Streptococcus pyogenes]VHM11656.1 Uncharacterised protein [Streptococcus pyogenes]
MKTKSKRFLNLATLCLALLGTTLLMAQPVKAEERIQVQDNSELLGSGIQQEDFEKAFEQGRDEGLKDGLKGTAKRDRNTITAPDGLPEDDYRDGYEQGYDEGYIGWSSEHPFQAMLGAAISFLSYVFGSLF